MHNQNTKLVEEKNNLFLELVKNNYKELVKVISPSTEQERTNILYVAKNIAQEALEYGFSKS